MRYEQESRHSERMSHEELESEPPGKREHAQPNEKSGGQATFRRKWRLRNKAALALLALLFVIGFFLSIVPYGRATTRTIYLLPELLSASQPGLLTLAEEPI